MLLIAVLFVVCYIFFYSYCCGLVQWADDTTGACTAIYISSTAGYPPPWKIFLAGFVSIAAILTVMMNFPPIVPDDVQESKPTGKRPRRLAD